MKREESQKKQCKLQKKKEHKVVYYTDELNDDFAGTNIKADIIDDNFKYIHKNPIWKFCSFFIYYVIAIPIVTFYCVVIKGIKIVNRKSIKKAKKDRKSGVFFYGNHTGVIDAFTPNIVSMPYKNKILVSPDTVSIKGIKNIIQMLGGIPVPSGIVGIRKFNEAIEYYINHKNNITIYPEAHIWPYYTGVRPFKDSSFAYPINLEAPVIAFFTAYSKPTGMFRCFKKANITIYVSDPIYPDINKPKKEAKKELRDKVFKFMEDCSKKYSTYDYIEYKHISEKPKCEVTKSTLINND